MGWLTFFTEIIKALAWPVAVVVILLLIRKPLTRLIPLLRKLKWKEWELEFDEKVVELKSAAQALPHPAKSAPELPSSDLTQLAEQSPRAAILEGWIKVERAAANAISKRLPPGGMATRSAQPKLLASHNILDTQQLHIYNGLRELRNKVVHELDGFHIDARRAAAYVRIAEDLASDIDQSSREH